MSAAPAGKRRAGPTTRAWAAALAAAGEAPGGQDEVASPLPELPEALVLHVLSFLPPSLQAWTARQVCKAAHERFRGARRVSLRCPELSLAAVQEAWRAVGGHERQQSRLANVRAACGDVAGLAWLRGAGCDMDSVFQHDSVCRTAMRAGQLAVLEWARGEGLDLRDVVAEAARHGQLAVLEWARDQGLDLGWACVGAALRGQLAVLRWARAQAPPLPWGDTCLCAVERGDLEMLRWACAQAEPAPWNWLSCFAAAEYGHLEALRWLRADGCEWWRGKCERAAARSGHAAVVAWIWAQPVSADDGPDWDSDDEEHEAVNWPRTTGGWTCHGGGLAKIGSSLIRQEDSIIFTLIERAQFARNAAVYEPGGVQVPAYGCDGTRLSLLEYLLRETEALHGKVRRYTSPDEHAFFPDDLPPLVLPPLEYPGVLAPAAGGININATILATYVDAILPGGCPEIVLGGQGMAYPTQAMSARTLDFRALPGLTFSLVAVPPGFTLTQVPATSEEVPFPVATKFGIVCQAPNVETVRDALVNLVRNKSVARRYAGLCFDGLNAAGLSGAYLWDNANQGYTGVTPPPLSATPDPPGGGKESVSYFDYPLRVLAECDTIACARALTARLIVVDRPLLREFVKAQFKLDFIPMHATFCDKSAACIGVEWGPGGVAVVRDLTQGVLTNSPQLPAQEAFLAQYDANSQAALGPKTDQLNWPGGLATTNRALANNSDIDSITRFIRAVRLRRLFGPVAYVDKPSPYTPASYNDTWAAFAQANSIIDACKITGAFPAGFPEKWEGEFTMSTSTRDHVNGDYYLRVGVNMNSHRFNVRKVARGGIIRVRSVADVLKAENYAIESRF
ncbi:CM1 [Scenedesmus sp. PABB004]|nr:CM1 [Scenedesmus sp. PABB004]